MHFDILGAESLGVRGLCCAVEIEDSKIVIDPGLALGYQRDGFLPHPAQVAIGEHVRRRIIAALEDATDVVMSHFRGDHVPMPDANPYQLQAQRVAPLCRTARLWAKGPEGLSPSMAHRRASLAEALGSELPNAEGQKDGPLAFCPPVPHGKPNTHLGTVMMTRVEADGAVFVHASDIQLLDDRAVSLLLDWRPDIALVGGPPLYLSKLSSMQRAAARQNLDTDHALVYIQIIVALSAVIEYGLLRPLQRRWQWEPGRHPGERTALHYHAGRIHTHPPLPDLLVEEEV